MIIHSITKKKNGVHVVANDSEFMIDSGVFSRYSFTEGEIDGREFFKMKEESDLLRCHNFLLSQINCYEKTKKGYLETLLNKGFPYAVCVDEIEKAAQKNYIDDRRFCECYLSQNKNKKGWNRMVLELKAKGVDEEIISSFQEEYKDGLSVCQKETDKLMQRAENTFEGRQKVMQKLLRKGFSYDEIKISLSNYGETDNSL